ncbi:MpaA2 family daptide-type RiPP [Microbacterium foliorum]|uniref:Uncharacterized protein n=1 Tax=Microbacterium foliorum TaxID=104336 RepID=A0A0F0KYV5_9MICO|nr:MpaA2 family daptide-type RiPP [Microbacterium foliorum]KJL25639.1 hypothetical protein RN50_00409 [Microbacterium foliorum]
MDKTLQALDYVELDAMEAPDDANDWVRGVAVGVIIGVLALT